jgi:hypothetical protein
MYRQALRESKPSTQLLFTALIIIISWLIVMILSIALGWLFFGINLAEMQQLIQNASNPKNIVVLKFFQTFQSIGVFIIPPFLIAWLFYENPAEFLKFDKKPGVRSVLFVIAIVLVANPFINFLSELNEKLSLPGWMSTIETWMQNSEHQADQLTKAFLATTSLSDLLANIAMIGILPALGEELLFRGIIQQLLKKKIGNAHAAIWISAAIFSALHMQFFGFLPRLVLGAMFGYMLEWSGTLWLPILAHFVNNATAVIAYYLSKKGLIGIDIDKTGTTSNGSSYLVIASILFLFILFKALYSRKETNLGAEI